MLVVFPVPGGPYPNMYESSTYSQKNMRKVPSLSNYFHTFYRFLISHNVLKLELICPFYSPTHCGRCFSIHGWSIEIRFKCFLIESALLEQIKPLADDFLIRGQRKYASLFNSAKARASDNVAGNLT